jgi:hypothetical protein
MRVLRRNLANRLVVIAPVGIAVPSGVFVGSITPNVYNYCSNNKYPVNRLAKIFFVATIEA